MDTSHNLKNSSLVEVDGEAFVVPKFKPEDSYTEHYVLEVLNALGLVKNRRQSTIQKLKYCLSDVYVATFQSKTGLICWQRDNDTLCGKAYGRDVADEVYSALETAGILILRQKGRRFHNAAVYQIDKGFVDDRLKGSLTAIE